MASSLAQQLSQVRSYNAAQLGNAKSASKVQSASYLFPPQVASTQDFETLQALGENGWEELSLYDTTFSKWDQVTGAGDLLFGESSRTLDRLMKSKEENEVIDRAISEFFALSGGILLDRSAGKCIEWLVRRFRVHEYNSEVVLSAFMPYHETQEFARMLQLLDLKDKPHFDFLLPSQKRAVALPSSLLISTLLGPPSSTASLTTLRWIIGLLSPKSTPRFRRLNHPLQSFWFSTVLKFCASIQGKNDEATQKGKTKGQSRTNRDDAHQLYLSTLLPASVDAALTTQLGSDCQIGGCLAICSIAASFNLSTEAIQSVCSSLTDAKMDNEKTRNAYLTAIVCLCMKSEGVDSTLGMDKSQLFMSGSTAFKLASKSFILTSIKSLSRMYDTTGFLAHFVAAMTFEADSPEIKLLEELLLDTDITSDSFLLSVVSSIVQCDGEIWTSLTASLQQGRPEVMVSLLKEQSPAQGSILNGVKEFEEGKSNRSRSDQEEDNQTLQFKASQVDVSFCKAIVAALDSSSGPASVYESAVSSSFDEDSQGTSSQALTTLFSRLGDSSLTLLASIWTTSNYRSEIRLSALRHGHAFLSAFATSDSKIRQVDFQTIIPSLLVALRDAEGYIRLEALHCFESILGTTSSIKERPIKGKKVEIYGYDTIYGQENSEPLKYLDMSDIKRFVDSLVQARASFEHDSFYLNTWLQRNLSIVRGEGKKEAASKSRIMEMICSHILCWTNYEAKLILLDSLSNIRDSSKLSSLLPLLGETIKGQLPTTLNKEQLETYVTLLFALYNSSAKEAIEVDEEGCWTLLLQGLEEGKPLVQKQAAQSLKRSVFDSLSDSKKKEIFARLANLVANSTVQLPAELRSCLIHLKMEPTAVVPILQDLRNVISSSALKTSQSKKVKVASAGLDEETWVRAMAVLVEILEALLSRKANPSSEYIAELFECLRMGIELLLSQHASSEYLMQISMSNLSASLSILVKSGQQQNVLAADVLSSLRIDTVVNVIKTPCNPQTFQQALLLLSTLGNITPEVVLHNVMPIFTFVGSTMLQRDDDFSFVVIEKTLQSILPPVIKDMASKAKGKGELALLQSSRNLLCVFTDAAKHVPRHRRVTFFHTLVSNMGSEYLAPICMLLTDRYASKLSKQSDLEEIRATLQLPLALFSKMDDHPLQLWSSLNSIWNEIERNWIHRGEDAVQLQEHVFLDCVGRLGAEHEGRRIGPIKRITGLIRFIYLAVIMNSDSLEEYNLQAEEKHEEKEQEKIMWGFIDRALLLSQVNNVAIRNVAQATLEEMMRIAPSHILFSVILKLLNSDKLDDKRSGLNLCSKSVSSMSDKDRQKETTSTKSIMKECYTSLSMKQSVLAEPALETLLAITQDCIPEEHAALSTGLGQLIALAKVDSVLQVQSLQLLLSLGKHLGPRLIPQLSELMSLSLKLLGETSTAPKVKGLVLDLLNCLIRSIPVFVASHIDTIVQIYIRHPSLYNLNQSSTLTSSIIRFTPTFQLLTTIFAVWQQGDKSSLALHTTCLELLERTIKVADKKSILSSYKNVFRQLTTIFDVRRQSVIDPTNWKLSPADLATAESKMVSVFLKLVLKLNEGAFRPLFLRFCDWAMLDLANEEEDDDDDEASKTDSSEIVARKIILFKVVNALLTELGELVTNYYLNVLDGAVDALKGFEAGQLDAEELWKQVVISLQRYAKADKGRGSFWNENRVKIIIPSLVGQMTTNLVRNSVSNESLLGDSISAICQTVPEETSLKMANNALLEKTRSNQTKVKITSIRILTKLWKCEECEDALLRLVPETVPSIAELLQESDVIVQEELGSFVTAVEKVLGEGLESYLQ